MKVNKLIEMERNNISKTIFQNNSIDYSQSIARPSEDINFPVSRASNRLVNRSRISSSKYQPKIQEIVKDKTA